MLLILISVFFTKKNNILKLVPIVLKCFVMNMSEGLN